MIKEFPHITTMPNLIIIFVVQLLLTYFNQSQYRFQQLMYSLLYMTAQGLHTKQNLCYRLQHLFGHFTLNPCGPSRHVTLPLSELSSHRMAIIMKSSEVWSISEPLNGGKLVYVILYNVNSRSCKLCLFLRLKKNVSPLYVVHSSKAM